MKKGQPRSLSVLFLEPFDGGSHRAFARGWAARSRHRLQVETLPARFWKWRLRGAAFAFAERPAVRAGRHDAVVATSMMNAADFRAAARVEAPFIAYFHENQLSYPRPPEEPLDHGLALASLSSAAAAEAVVFNSRFHERAFFGGLREWAARFPEYAPRRTLVAIRKRAHVISPGIDWQGLSAMAERREERREEELDASEPSTIRRTSGSTGRREESGSTRRRDAPRSTRATQPMGLMGPLLLWNHRWEFDKNPGAFFAALEVLAARGREFRLALLGENTQFVPKPFLEARERFRTRIVRYGYVPSERSYRSWLGRADIVVSTARQENFGLSIAEAVAAGAFPLLPARLSYPELLPRSLHADCLYRTQQELVGKLDRLLARPERIADGRCARSRLMKRYDWSMIAPRLDALVEEVVKHHGRKGKG